MSGVGTFKLTEYCQCGASMVGSGAGDMSAVDELQSAWWSVHSGEGHGPATRQEAANARKREARKEAKRIRELNR